VKLTLAILFSYSVAQFVVVKVFSRKFPDSRVHAVLHRQQHGVESVVHEPLKQTLLVFKTRCCFAEYSGG
jgi:hypothetical protein